MPMEADFRMRGLPSVRLYLCDRISDGTTYKKKIHWGSCFQNYQPIVLSSGEFEPEVDQNIIVLGARG